MVRKVGFGCVYWWNKFCFAEQILWVINNNNVGFLHTGCVWIELIFAETENWNWKHCSEIIFKCVNSIVGPIFNKKKLLKSVICGTINSTYMHCSQLAKSTIAGWKKKKKKKKKRKTWRRKHRCANQTVTLY